MSRYLRQTMNVTMTGPQLTNPVKYSDVVRCLGTEKFNNTHTNDQSLQLFSQNHGQVLCYTPNSGLEIRL